MDVGLTTIEEQDIVKHLAVAQAMVTRFVSLDSGDGKSGTEIAGTGRRFVSTVSTGGMRKTREVELANTIQSVRADDQMLSIDQHTLLFRARRGVTIALAVADVFGRQTDLESLKARNHPRPLQGQDASISKRCCRPRPISPPFPLAAYLTNCPGEGEPAEESREPDYLFDTPQDALKSMVAGLDRAIAGVADEQAMLAAPRPSRARDRRPVPPQGPVHGLGSFENAHAARQRRFHARRLRRDAVEEA